MAHGDVFHQDISGDGFKGAVGALFIDEIDLENGIGDAANLHVAHENVFDDAAADGVGFEAQDALETGTVHVAILGVDVVATAGNFAPDDDTAMAIFHRAVSDDVILRSDAHAAAIVVAT